MISMVDLEGFAVNRDFHGECFPRSTKEARESTYLSGCGLVPVKLCLQEEALACLVQGGVVIQYLLLNNMLVA